MQPEHTESLRHTHRYTQVYTPRHTHTHTHTHTDTRALYGYTAMGLGLMLAYLLCQARLAVAGQLCTKLRTHAHFLRRTTCVPSDIIPLVDNSLH